MKRILWALLALLTVTWGNSAALALEPPEPGMIEEMAADGTLQDALEFARELGNHELKAPLRGALKLDEYSPQEIVDLISQNLGRSLKDRSTSDISRSTSVELSWMELDLNYDGVVDERDVLALGRPRPKTTAQLPSIGTSYMFVLIIDFPDYPAYFTQSHINDMVFGSGWASNPYRGLHYYYDKASYTQLNIAGSVYGWYTAAHNRAYYHPNDNNSYPEDTSKRQELIWEAITAADAAGTDFSTYDNDGDSIMDQFGVVWTGPHGNWATFWWGYNTSWNGSTNVVDGVRPGNYSWQWERYYGFSGTPPTPAYWSANTLIHETGHGLGLPDWYDYDDTVGPDGGVGGLDMMHGYGDHSCYNKYLLGWVNPTIAYANLNDESLLKSNNNADAVLFMPGFDPVSPWTEFFMVQNRKQEGVDTPIPGNGLIVWHIDANLSPAGYFLYDNSYSSHKQLRLMEADGLEEIETGDGNADAGDFYTSGDVLSPTSTPDSDDYDGNSTGITLDDISATADTMTCDITMFTSNPPSVTINSPSGGATVSGDTTVSISASDDVSVSKVQLIIDGQLVKEWTSSPYSYTWNTLVEFNGTVSVTARAWDNEDQASSDTISVTVSNTGVTGQTDTFESGLGLWRVVNFPEETRGWLTNWSTRPSPGDGTPLGTGKEAYVMPNGANNVSHSCLDYLRSQRINATAYTYGLFVTFYYRCFNGFELWATTDNGSSWQKLDTIGSAANWQEYSRIFNMQGQTLYLEFRYSGTVRADATGENSRGANIDNFSAVQAPSNPPTVSITSHSDNDVVSGSTTFTASASDDGSVTKVEFYLQGSLRHTDTTSPYQYTRNTLNDDNHPSIDLTVVATDNDSLPADDSVTLVWKNPRPYPCSDDLEGGDGEWSYQNDTNQPPWAIYSGDGSSGSKSMGWTGTIGANNSEGVFYWGDPPTEGRHCIDLSGSIVNDPKLRYKIKGDVPMTFFGGLYFYTTWDGFIWMGSWGGDYASWTDAELDLSPLQGYSGRLCWWLWSGTDTSGTGIWLDDVSVSNTTPTIGSITPDRGTVGTNVTISGAAFGDTQGTSTLTFGGGAVAGASDIVSWSSTQIVSKIPSGAVTGGAYVTVGGDDSNSVTVTVVLGPPIATGLDQL